VVIDQTGCGEPRHRIIDLAGLMSRAREPAAQLFDSVRTAGQEGQRVRVRVARRCS
jgi:hypothetical protein